MATLALRQGCGGRSARLAGAGDAKQTQLQCERQAKQALSDRSLRQRSGEDPCEVRTKRPMALSQQKTGQKASNQANVQMDKQ
jgi:hypothetical protein